MRLLPFSFYFDAPPRATQRHASRYKRAKPNNVGLPALHPGIPNGIRAPARQGLVKMLKNRTILKNVKNFRKILKNFEKGFHKCSTTFQQIYFSKNVQQLKFNKCFRCNSASAAEFNKCSTNVQQLKFNKSSTNVFLMVLFFFMVLGFFLWFWVFLMVVSITDGNLALEQRIAAPKSSDTCYQHHHSLPPRTRGPHGGARDDGV